MTSANLDVTLALLDVTARGKVSSRRIRWESMARVLQILRRSFRESPDSPLSDREVEVAQAAWTWASVCMDGPVPPGHATTGFHHLLNLISEADEHLQLPKLKRLHEAVDQVAQGPHPAADAIVSAIAAHASEARAEDDSHRHVMVLRGDGLEGVREWCDQQGIPVDVVKVSDARKSKPWKCLAFIFGPPERYTASVWVQSSEAAATAGWLLTAPPAPDVRMISWTGHRPMAKDGYQPWLGAPEPTVNSREPDLLVEDDFLPESLDTFTPVATPKFSSDEDETEEAFGLQFHVHEQTVLAYFSPEVGPKPTTVTFSDDEVLVSQVSLRSIHLGNCLMLRTSSAGKAALDAATREWFKQQPAGSTPDAAIGHQQALKKAIQNYVGLYSRTDLVDALEAEGVERDYARAFVGRALHPDFIAPQRENVYDKVCRAVRLEKPEEAFRQLKNLRTGRRQAGLAISSRIAEKLESMTDLSDQLRDTGAVLLSEPGVEGVALLVVRNISSDPTEIPTWRLGQALTSEGQTWNP